MRLFGLLLLSIFIYGTVAHAQNDFQSARQNMAEEVNALHSSSYAQRTDLRPYGDFYPANAAFQQGLIAKDLLSPSATIIGCTPMNALDFDGVNDYVDCGVVSKTQIGNDFSIAQWVRTTSTSGSKTFLTNQWVFSHSGLLLGIVDGKLHYAFAQSSGNWDSRTPNILINDGAWHYVVLTFASGSVLSYVDGKLIDTYTSSLTFVEYNNSNKLIIGKDGGSGLEWWPGKIDEVSIWDKVLSLSEVKALMRGKLAGTETNLVAYYDFDQGSAAADNTGLTTLIDKTTNAANGTLQNFSLNGTGSNWVQGYMPPITGKIHLPTCSSSSTLSHAISAGSWSSADPGVATINASSGLVTAVTAGVTTVTYTLCDGSASTALVHVGNNALDFDGSNDYVETNSFIVPHTGDFTVEFWVKSSTNGLQNFVSQGTFGTNFYIGTRDGQIRVTDAWNTTNVPFPLNQWVHLAVVKNGTNAVLYMNGDSAASTTGFGISAPYSGFRIGRQFTTNDEYSIGGIDEVRIWSVARNASQIRSNFRNTLEGTEEGLLAYYDFDYGIANGNNSGLTTLPDLSGNGNNGTLNNFLLSGTSSNWVNGPSLPVKGVMRLRTCLDTATLSHPYSGGAWSSSDINVATINSNGLVTAVSAGTATISYTLCDGAIATAQVFVGNNALHFDGSNDYVETGKFIVPSVGDFTVEFWVKSSTNGLQNFVSQGTFGTNFYIGTRDGQIRVTDAWNTTNVPFPLNQWVHLAVVKNGTNAVLYMNGDTAATTTGFGISAPYSGFRIGRQFTTNDEYSIGEIDELRIWSVARTALQIKGNLHTNLSGTTEGLLAYYGFDYGIANGNNAGITTLPDLTGNGNNGTLNNFALNNTTSNWVDGYIDSITGPRRVAVSKKITLSHYLPGGTWSTTDGSQISLNSSTGVVTGVAAGTATVTYTSCDGKNTSYRVEVYVPTNIELLASFESPHQVQYSDSAYVRAVLTDDEGNPVPGKRVNFSVYNGDTYDDPDLSNQLFAITDENGIADTLIQVTLDPDPDMDFEDQNGAGAHILAYFEGDEVYGEVSLTENFNVRRENAVFIPYGPSVNQEADQIMFNNNPGSGYIVTTVDNTKVNVKVRIDEADDNSIGDITNAKVKFVITPNGSTTPTSYIADVSADGTAEHDFDFSTGTIGANNYKVHVYVGNYYRGRLNTTFTIQKENATDVFSGGGDMHISQSAGKLAADSNTVARFGFGAKYNKTASKVQGKAYLVFRSNGRSYEITGGGIPAVTMDQVTGLATYATKATITDISSDGDDSATSLLTSPANLMLYYNVTDGYADLVSIKVSDGSTLWFTNKGAGAVTDKQVLLRGGVTVNAAINAPIASGVSRCGPGTLSLTATPPSGATVDWYDAQTGGNRVATGSATLTVYVNATTSYYAESRNTLTGAISFTRTPVTATINMQPEPPLASGNARCGSGTVTLSATIPSNATIAWYSSATGGTALGSASTYTTPSISNTSNFYVESKSGLNNCVSASRTMVTAVINLLPTAPVVTSASSCGPGSVSLAANVQSGMQVEWYTASTGGTAFNIGWSTYQTPVLSTSTTYYTLSKNPNTGCSSSTRSAVAATINTVPAAPSSIAGTVSTCPSSTKALTFTAAKVTNATSYIWTKPSCATGTSTTNSISLTFSKAGANDSVVARAVNASGCVSSARGVKVTTSTSCSACTMLSAAGNIRYFGSESVMRESGSSAIQLNVFPNPNKGKFNLALKGFAPGAAVIRVLDFAGTVIYMKQHNLTNDLNILQLNISKVNRGGYWIQVMQSGEMKAVKILKE